MFGGNDNSGILADAFTLDLASWEWSVLAGAPPARSGACAVAIGPKVSTSFCFSEGLRNSQARDKRR